MTEAERAAAQAIFAEQVETYEARLREQERTFTAIVQELEAEKTGLLARVRELERQRELMADGLELYCNYARREDGDCPFWIECPNGRPCTGEATDKMWIEFFERKAAKEAGK